MPSIVSKDHDISMLVLIAVHVFVERTEKPTVLKHLLDREITEDEDCSFETEVSGKPTPTVTWLVERPGQNLQL